MKAGPRMVADQFEKILFAAKTAQVKPALAAEVYGWMMEKDPAGLAGGLLAMAGRKDYTALLDRFRLPSLVIGAEEDQAVPVENSRTLALGLPQSRLRIIPGAGHMANLEQPEAFNACLIDFLRSSRRGNLEAGFKPPLSSHHSSGVLTVERNSPRLRIVSLNFT